MNLIAVTLREETVPDRGEVRDALDRRWIALLRLCGAQAVMLPNDVEMVRHLLTALPVEGVLLTGGGMARGDCTVSSPRDLVECELLTWSLAHRKPVLGVCRGMQVLLAWEDVTPIRLSDHVRTRHTLDDESCRIVNSYHEFGFFDEVPRYRVRARAPDGSIEWIEDATRRRMGIMWHPEREAEFAAADIALISAWFKTDD